MRMYLFLCNLSPPPPAGPPRYMFLDGFQPSKISGLERFELPDPQLKIGDPFKPTKGAIFIPRLLLSPQTKIDVSSSRLEASCAQHSKSRIGDRRLSGDNSLESSIVPPLVVKRLEFKTPGRRSKIEDSRKNRSRIFDLHSLFGLAS